MQNTLEIIKVVHPGKFLEQELLKQNINKRQFAIAIGEYPQTLGSIIKGNRRMNVELSLKIEEKLKLEEGFLMTLQVFYNLKQAKKKNQLKPDISKLSKVLFWDSTFDKIDFGANESGRC